MPKSKGLSQLVTMRFTPDLARELDAEARRQGRTRSNLVRHILETSPLAQLRSTRNRGTAQRNTGVTTHGKV